MTYVGCSYQSSPFHNNDPSSFACPPFLTIRPKSSLGISAGPQEEASCLLVNLLISWNYPANSRSSFHYHLPPTPLIGWESPLTPSTIPTGEQLRVMVPMSSDRSLLKFKGTFACRTQGALPPHPGGALCPDAVLLVFRCFSFSIEEPWPSPGILRYPLLKQEDAHTNTRINHLPA